MFSKYDVYTTVQSMYCYPDTDVLIAAVDDDMAFCDVLTQCLETEEV